jgi:glycosyltransferase involved in cell wall biosynthesis
MTAALGAWVARSKRTRLYLDIRDIFVDTIKDVLPRRFAPTAKTVFGILEGWAIRKADRVNLISKGFATYFNERYPNQHYSYFSNGIDTEFLPGETTPARVSPNDEQPLSVVYAGNIGEGQGLHLIIPKLAKRLQGRVTFTVIGDGGRHDALQRALDDLKVHNVVLLPPMARAELIAAYREADVLFLHLNDYEAFKKVLPSKIFEYAAMGKPIWAGVAGYAAEFISSEVSNSAIFEPCGVESAIASFEKLAMIDVTRSDFIKKYTRENIAKEMAHDILQLAESD